MNAIGQDGGIYGSFQSLGQSGMNTGVQNMVVMQGRLEGSNVNLTQSMVGQMTAQNSMNTNVQVIQTADSMLQALLDIKA